MSLKPGDLCVILPHSDCESEAQRKCVGRTVVLLRIKDTSHLWLIFPELAPYWECTGLPHGTIVSHTVLRKIPPDEMTDRVYANEVTHA